MSKLALNPFYVALVTVILALLGLAGSVYSDPFNETGLFKKVARVAGDVDRLLGGLVLLFGCGVFFLGVGAYARIRNREAVTDAFHDRLNELEGALSAVRAESAKLAAQNRVHQVNMNALREAIRLVPGANMMTPFGALFVQCQASANLAFRCPPSPDRRDLLVEAVQETLHALLDMFEVYYRRANPDAPPVLRRAASVLYYHPAVGTPPVLARALNGRLRFRNQGARFEDFAGVLDIQHELSVCHWKRCRTTPDEKLTPFAFPIPEVGERTTIGSRWANGALDLFPGAPIAFAIRGVNHFHDAIDLVEWSRQRSSLDGHARTDLLKYLNQQRAYVRSFMGIGLDGYGLGPLGHGPLATPVGALALHLDQPGKLSKEHLQHFKKEAEPFVLLARQVLTSLRRDEAV